VAKASKADFDKGIVDPDQECNLSGPAKTIFGQDYLTKTI
jgi:hypothetical protein